MNNKSIIFLICGFCLSASVAAVGAPIMLRSGYLEPQVRSNVQLQAFAPQKGGYYIVQFAGPPRKEWRQTLNSLGAKIKDYIPENAYIVRLSPKLIPQVKALPFVSYLDRLHPKSRLEPRLKQIKAPRVNVLVKLFPGEGYSDLYHILKSVKGVILPESQPGRGIMIVSVPRTSLDQIAGLEGIEWMEEWVAPRVVNNVAAAIMGLPEVRQRTSLFGAGQIIAFADTGLDSGNTGTLSADFAGRIFKAYGIRRPGDWSDVGGHGTFVMGCAVGSGALSGSSPNTHTYTDSFAGVAPEASIIVQSIGDNTGFVYPPVTLIDLFQPPYVDGARVHSDSWGSPVGGSYTTYSQQLDDFVWNHKDSVIVFPAGNDGVDSNSDGKTDPTSLYAPGTAKNCITVGATESNRIGGRTDTYGIAWSSDFPAQPIKDDTLSNNSNGMAAWSSRGPCLDGRIKPDICAPGTNIISSKSHAVNNNGWLAYDSNYCYWGGTSFSTPMVAGGASLVRQNYIENLGVSPSAALVKATLLNGARDITPGQYGTLYGAEVPVRPNSVEGWGRMDLSATIDPPSPKQIEFIDETSGITTGQTRQYEYQVQGTGTPLVITLVWTDPPASPLAAKCLINDLNLTVQGPAGPVYLGNGTVDNTNNVESVDVPTPEIGKYTVTISAPNVPQGPQPFALVVSGELPGAYISGTLATSTGNPIPGAFITAVDGLYSKTTTTASNGHYTLRVPAGNYTVTATKTGWTFDPPSANETVGVNPVTGVNFTGSAPTGSISGTLKRTLGGVTAYELESDHPYYNNSNAVYTIAGPPAAPSIRVHFDEVALQNSYDFLYVEDINGNIIDTLNGAHVDMWSSWVTGNTVRLRLSTDATFQDFGFRVDGYETSLIQEAAPAGITITAQPGNHTAVTGVNGTYQIPNLEPVAYTVTASYPHWTFRPDSQPSEVPPGGADTNVDFQALPPSTITGTISTGAIQQVPYSLESSHPYPDNSMLTYTVNGPAETTRIRVHFTQIYMEPGFDFIDIRDASDTGIDTYTGQYNDQWTSWVDGDSLKIVLSSDDGFSYYGFAVDKYEVILGVQGVPGVLVTAQPGNLTTTTNANGTYTIPTAPLGVVQITPSSLYWSFSPAMASVNAVHGLTTVANFLATSLGPVPVARIGEAKALVDGAVIQMAGKVVIAGSNQQNPSFKYIQEPDHSSGIRIITYQSIAEGDIVTVQGMLKTVGGERVLDASSVTVTDDLNPAPVPVFMRLSAMGGIAFNVYTPGVHVGYGLNNLGILIEVAGKVTSVGSGYFTIDDGSRGNGLGEDTLGVKVSCGSLSMPLVDDIVRVIGISSCEPSGESMIRLLRVRHQTDIIP